MSVEQPQNILLAVSQLAVDLDADDGLVAIQGEPGAVLSSGAGVAANRFANCVLGVLAAQVRRSRSDTA